MGRPTSFSAAVQRRIVTALRDGCTRRAAAAAGGVSKETFYQWLKQFPDFSDAVTAAEDEAEAKMTRVIAKAAYGYKIKRTKQSVDKDGKIETETLEEMRFDWKAALEWLKRRRREDWADEAAEGSDENEAVEDDLTAADFTAAAELEEAADADA